MDTVQGTRMHKSVLLSVLLTVVLIFSMGVPSQAAQAAGTDKVTNLNVSIRDDASTSVHLNWYTGRTTSSKTPQPNTAVIYCEAGKSIQNEAVTQRAERVEYDRRAFHKASITNLKPATTYTYVVIDADSKEWLSAEHSFTTASKSELSFLCVPEANYRTTSSYQNHWGSTLNTALAAYPDADFVMHNGDYGSSANEAHMDGFFTLAPTVLPDISFVPVPASADSSNRYFSYNFNLPSTNMNTENYSLEYDDALVLVLNAARTSTKDITAHKTWLRDQVNAKGGDKWIIVSMGKSFYGKSSNTSTIKRELEKVFDEIGVNLVIQGGDDTYTRSYLIKGASYFDEYPSASTFAKGDGTIYLTPGSAGAEYSAPSSSAKWLQVAPNYSSSATKKAAEYKSYSHITVTKETLSVTARTAAGETIDSFEFNRQPTPQPEPRPLEHDGLNNGFGSDPQTTRSIAWQTNTTMTSPFVDVVDPQTQETTRFQGTSEILKQYFTGSSGRTAHKVALSGLKPGTTYEYRIGNIYTSTKSGVPFTYLSDTFTFTTEATNVESFTVLHMADSQGSSSKYTEFWGNTLQSAMNRFPDAAMVIHTGDMVDTSNKSHWEAFFDGAGTNLSSPVFMPALGNHENYAKSTSEPFTSSVFNVGAELGQPMTYSYVYGNALFINLNSNYDKKEQLIEQGAWVERRVAEVRQEKGDDLFVIVSFHKAPFGGTHAKDSDVKRIKEILVPYLERAKVDLVLQGHDHNYIRSYPIKNGVPNTAKGGSVINTSEDGVVFLLSRNSGEKTYSVTSRKDYMDVLWDHTSVRYSKDKAMYSALTFEGDKLIITAYCADGTIIDQFEISHNAGTRSLGADEASAAEEIIAPQSAPIIEIPDSSTDLEQEPFVETPEATEEEISRRAA